MNDSTLLHIGMVALVLATVCFVAGLVAIAIGESIRRTTGNFSKTCSKALVISGYGMGSGVVVFLIVATLHLFTALW